MTGMGIVSVKSASNLARLSFRRPLSARDYPCAERAMLSRFYESDCHGLSIFSTTGGGGGGEEFIDALSTVSRLYRTGWPTYEVNSRWTITQPLMKVWERHPSESYRDLIVAAVSRIITLCMREDSLSASVSEIRWIRCLLVAAGSNFRFIIKLYAVSFINQY